MERNFGVNVSRSGAAEYGRMRNVKRFTVQRINQCSIIYVKAHREELNVWNCEEENS